MTYSMLLSRRDFLRAAAAASAAGLSRTLQAAGPRGRKPSIGLQLYAVRGEFARDVPGALQTVARIGYQGVEFWGYGGEPKVFRDYAAEDLRKLLDKTGLKCCGMHLQLRAIQGDRLQRTVRVNQLLGNRRLIVAAAEAYMRSEKKIAELAALLNETAARLRPRGMRIGYHAHPFDFRKIGDACAWELLFRQTRPEVMMQMDVGNCLAGGGDPIAMLKEFPGRTPTIHLKEHEEKTFDSPYYREVFRLCETICGTRWYIVEMGGPGGNGFDVPRQAFRKLRALGKTSASAR